MPPLFSWFDLKEVDAFADSLAAMVVRQFPVAEITDPKRKGKARWERVHKAIFTQAEGFANTHPLNIYKKARLGNRLKWSLLESGYPQEFVDGVAYELVRFVALPAADRKRILLSQAAK